MQCDLKKAAFPAALIIVAASVLTLAYMTLIPFIEFQVRDLTFDIDWGYFNRGLDRIHSFRDTARWWTGPWCGEVPFWRPLTSYVFWAERLLWPKEYMLPRQIILVTLHLIFVGMAGYLAWKLTGRRWLVLISIWLFAGFRTDLITGFFGYNPAVYYSLVNPENIMDPLAGIAMMASLILLVNGRWPASLAAAAVSVGFKEIGFMTWPMALLTVVWIRWSKPSSVPSSTINHQPLAILPVSAWLAGFLTLAVVHYLTVGVGYRLGANAAWLARAELYFGGPVVKLLILGNPSPAVFAFVVFLAIIGSKRYSLLPRFAVVLAALAVGVLLDMRLQHASWDVSTVRLLTYRLDLRVVLVCLFWLLVAWAARHDWRTVGFTLGMCFIAALPTWAAAQAQEHTRYIASFFMEMAVAAALCAAAAQVSPCLSRHRTEL